MYYQTNLIKKVFDIKEKMADNEKRILEDTINYINQLYTENARIRKQLEVTNKLYNYNDKLINENEKLKRILKEQGVDIRNENKEENNKKR